MTEEETLDDVLNSSAVAEKSEMGEVFDNFDNDVVNPLTKKSKIDLNTNLSDTEITTILAFEGLQGLGLTAVSSDDMGQSLPEIKKRLNVSKQGWGRNGKISVASGILSARTNAGGFMSKLFSQRQP